VLTVEAAAALDLLDALSGGLNPASGPEGLAAAGGSVRYFCAVGALAADLASLGRVLPGLSGPAGAGPGGGEAGGYPPDPGAQPAAGSRWEARWRPVLTGAHAQRARDLALAMPPVCRSAAAAGEAPALVLASALDALTDAAVRARISPDGEPPTRLLPRRRGRKPPRVPVAERWITALTVAGRAGALVQVDDSDPEDAAEARALAAALDAWRASAQAPAGPVRTCFRLSEPAEPKEPENTRNPEGRGGRGQRAVAGRVPASGERRPQPGGPGRGHLVRRGGWLATGDGRGAPGGGTARRARPGRAPVSRA
jgi:hypothetical protein